jgi:hypothetical protein
MMAALTRHLKKIWTGISKAGEAYNDSVVSYDRSVRPHSDRSFKLKRGRGKELAEAKVLDLKIR